ncbi:gephyrin [Diachasma alloeum]|uniref:gephyrin n=1 Tax=Diachasma alloeum TaxID=454923 RepID=UPI000738463F|nr:gephyrin [Diachasma alloeum]
MAPITFGILTISDTCARDPTEDRSGEELIRLITDHSTDSGRIIKGHVAEVNIVPDNEFSIMEILTKWSDEARVNVILTTGGTGFSPRDVTPEATKKIIQKEAPGIALAMLTASLKITPMAALSRAACGIRNKTLIINLPGSPKAARECLDAIAMTIPHAVDLLLDSKPKIKETHEHVQNSGCRHHSENGTIALNLGHVAGRLRESPYHMISMKEAEEIINRYTWQGENEFVDLWDCHGRILSEDIRAQCDLPPFRASIKDGYAVVASDGGGQRRVLGGLEAGHSPGSIKLEPGFCVRVNTGAPVPEEATAVVQVEDTKLLEKTADGKEEKTIEILVAPKEHQDIRPVGSDIEEGSLVLKRHTRIGAVEAGILAACGCTKVKVTKLPTIGILSTGNELQQAGEEPRPGHVYDSNKITLMMLFREFGYAPKDMGIAIDDENVMIDSIKEALSHVDVLVTTGSVSMGDRDMLKPILTQVFKADIHFGRVNMKPGKPTTFATCQYDGKIKYFVCLPGNPVSATVTSHLFAIPLLHRLAGNYARPVVVRARLTSSYKLDSRPEYARAILMWSEEDPMPKAYSTGNQISSKLLSCKNANALLMLPGRTDDRGEMLAGDVVQAMLLGFQQNAI